MKRINIPKKFGNLIREKNNNLINNEKEYSKKMSKKKPFSDIDELNKKINEDDINTKEMKKFDLNHEYLSHKSPPVNIFSICSSSSSRSVIIRILELLIFSKIHFASQTIVKDFPEP